MPSYKCECGGAHNTFDECPHKKEPLLDERINTSIAQFAANGEKVPCSCGISAYAYLLFRCVYCGEFYCQSCAEKHFNKTREEYLKELEESKTPLDKEVE